MVGKVVGEAPDELPTTGYTAPYTLMTNVAPPAPNDQLPEQVTPDPGTPERATPEQAPPEQATEEQVYQSLHAAIVERRLVPGVKLPEQQLSKLFRISRSRVRSVLARLAQERYVDLKAHRGAFVAWPSPQEAREIFAAREVLEAHVVRQLAGRLTSAQTAALREHLEHEQGAALRQDHRESIRLSGAFHLHLATLAGNTVLSGLLEGLIVRSSLIIALYGGPTLHACADDEHARLLEHISSGDAPAAQQALSEHLGHILASLDLRGQGEHSLDLGHVLKV